MNMRARRSMNCIPRKVFTPMNINTPYSTGIGISLERNMMISIVETTTMMLMNINTPYSTGIGISLEGNMMILMVDNDVDLLENRSKLCRESNKKENTDASDSLERKPIT